jgi:hypothetical protein
MCIGKNGAGIKAGWTAAQDVLKFTGARSAT